MVSITSIILIAGVGIFFLAGGAGLTKSAFTQVKSDISTIRGTASEVLPNFRDTKIGAFPRPLDKAGEMIV